MHIEFFLEEPSAEAFLQEIVHKLLPADVTSSFIVFQGKHDLLTNLKPRLKGYRNWISDDYKIVVLVDEDREDCKKLKAKLEAAAAAAGLATKTNPKRGSFVVLNRIAIEELEAWFFGDISAMTAAYPRVSSTLGAKARYRDPDAIAGGTWEALERVLLRAGYFGGGLPKIEVAREMAKHMDPARNTSASFGQFVQGLASL